jgi:hypothetical protein
MSVITPIVNCLIQSSASNPVPILPIQLSHLSEEAKADVLWENLNAAFLILLAGEPHADYESAKAYLEKLATTSEWGDWAKFYLDAVSLINTELEQCCQKNPELKTKFEQVAATLSQNPTDEIAIAQTIWSVLFPEGVGILGQEENRIAQLREKRTVKITQLNPNPIQNPAKQVLFTSNVLLTTPLKTADLSAFDQDFQSELAEASQEPQRYWYDHPIPIGVAAEHNEIIYGLKHLNQAVEFEREQNSELTEKVNCVLSLSVTHEGLQTLGKEYLKQVIAANQPLEHLNVFAFTEADTNALIQEVLRPIVEHCCADDAAKTDLLSVFGVDGRYGRHYSFLKAIAAFWNVLIDPDIKATFKIDLDQVFPQAELMEQTGASAFEHLQTPLWGAIGEDAIGNPIELGMIAGALVNQKDIHQGIFTPDVKFPSGELQPDEYVFFSKLPQALSTEAEMMTRYQLGNVPDGNNTCLQRIHVTGGTNGILVDSLRRFQTFTPSFIARAEDQAYLLSSLTNIDPFNPPSVPLGKGQTREINLNFKDSLEAPTQINRLGYVHQSGLIMRHDKEGFAQEAIAMAKVSKQIGDYLRILMFSAYARTISQNLDHVKTVTDPFTGCFISHLPKTVTLLRFALKVATLFNQGNSQAAIEFIRTGVPQLKEALHFTQGEASGLQEVYERELQGWQLFYQALNEVEKALQAKEAWALAVQKAAQKIVSECFVN